jgi:hypothetical protein
LLQGALRNRSCDRAMCNPISERIANGGLVEIHSVRGNLGRADHALAQVLNELVRSLAGAFAGSGLKGSAQ